MSEDQLDLQFEAVDEDAILPTPFEDRCGNIFLVFLAPLPAVVHPGHSAAINMGIQIKFMPNCSTVLHFERPDWLHPEVVVTTNINDDEGNLVVFVQNTSETEPFIISRGMWLLEGFLVRPDAVPWWVRATYPTQRLWAYIKSFFVR